MKPIYISLFIGLISLKATAQTNFYKLSLGAGAGITQSFADLQKHDFGLAAYGTADFFFTPFLSIGGELQMGEVNGGDVNTDPHERQFINSYKAASINGKLYLGAVADYHGNSFVNAIKWLYVGSGAGIIHNSVNRVKIQPSTGYSFPGKSVSNELLVPLNLGINFYFSDYAARPRFGINLNFQSNITFGEGLDGYDDTVRSRENGNPDIYNFLSVGIRYNFGLVGLSNKSLYR